MAKILSRRRFVSSITAGTTLSPAISYAAANSDAQSSYSFLVLGDTHFDRREHHDFDWMRQSFAKDISQVESYCRHTQDRLPQLLKHATATLRTVHTPAAFALHVGDLVEGICGNQQLAVQHCQEGWEFFKASIPELPLLMTKGNHDVTGPGSVQAYEQVLMTATARELERPKLERTCYSFQRGKDLYAVFDAYDRTSIDWLEILVRENEFRRLFVLLHMPVVPYNARSNWRVYYHPKQAERRQRLIDLLGRHHAIVLCGHLHKYSVLVRQCRTGRFVQLALSSIVKDSDPGLSAVLSSVNDYGSTLVNDEPKFSPDTLADRRKILTDEQPHIRHFEYAHKSGFAVVHVTDQDVQADIYNGGKRNEPWKTISLSKLL